MFSKRLPEMIEKMFGQAARMWKHRVLHKAWYPPESVSCRDHILSIANKFSTRALMWRAKRFLLSRADMAMP
jgi:hypothetical protein